MRRTVLAMDDSVELLKGGEGGLCDHAARRHAGVGIGTVV